MSSLQMVGPYGVLLPQDWSVTGLTLTRPSASVQAGALQVCLALGVDMTESPEQDIYGVPFRESSGSMEVAARRRKELYSYGRV